MKIKIKVKPEGRENIYIPQDKENLKDYIRELGIDEIHNFIPLNAVMLGADHSLESVLEDIDRAERMGVFTDNSNMGHSLALILNNKLECFDIGEIHEKNLEIITE